MEIEDNVINCSQCGREIPKKAEKCEYCGSWFEKPLNGVGEDFKFSLKCKSCGTIVEEENAYFCPECGRKIRRKNIITRKLEAFDVEHERNAWPKRLSISLIIWGVINLLVASPLFGGVLIFFSVLIYASRSNIAIYAFAIIWLFFAFIQLVTGITFMDNPYMNSLIFILFSLVNFTFAGYTIYETRVLNEGFN